MLKTSVLSFSNLFSFPKIKSKAESGPQINTRAGVVVTSRSSLQSKAVSVNPTAMLSLLVAMTICLLFALHVYWINTYSAKGFELKKLQTSIEVQDKLQKKLLVEQSVLSSTISLTGAENVGLVPVTNVEFLAGASFAQAK